MSILKEFSKDKLKIIISDTRNSMGRIAGEMIGAKIKQLLENKQELNIIFAAAPSQNESLEALINYEGIDWTRINAFHMDEYIGLPKDAPQGFGNYLKDRIFSKLNFKKVEYINGKAEDLEAECERYSKLLIDNPADIVCMGIGENGHIAFNDPWVADFNDSKLVKAVKLDPICRQQQVNDGCFGSLEQVPKTALTLTIPALTKANHIFCIVPASAKCQAVFNTVRGEISALCPASVLRLHDDATLFCDADSGKKILFRKAIITDEITQDFEKAAILASKYGFEALEIRSVWDKPPHELNDEDIAKINEIASRHNLKICAISSSVFKCDMNNKAEILNNYEVLEKCAVLAKKTGAEFIRAFTFWYNNGIKTDIEAITSQIKVLSDILAKYNLTLVIESDPSVSAANADELAILFKKLDVGNVKVLWDPGNQIYNKNYTVPFPDGYELIKNKIAHVHLKDAVRNDQGKADGVAIGEGMLDIKGQLSALLNDHYDGYIVLEPHFRLKSKLSEKELALPGGSKFSDGGYEASEISMQKINDIIDDTIKNYKDI